MPEAAAPRGRAAEALAVVAAAALAATEILAPAAAPPYAGAAALALVTLWIMWRDARDFIIPDGASAALGLLALGARLMGEGVSAETALMALGEGTVCGGALWAVREGFYRLRGHDGLGFGDVKLAAALGVLVGVFGFALALLAASIAGVAIALLRGDGGRSEKLAFGALLAPAAYAVWASGLGPAGLV